VFKQWQRCRVGGSSPPTTTPSWHRYSGVSVNGRSSYWFGSDLTRQKQLAEDAL